MATTTLDLKTRLRARIGSPSLVALPDASAIAYVNRGYQHTLDQFVHPITRGEYTLNTVSGTAAYTIPRAYRALMRLWNKDYGTRIAKVTHTRLFEFRAGDNRTTTGKPKWYYKNGTELRLMPTPNAAYELIALCKVKLDDLTLDAHEVQIDDWDDIIVSRAVYSYYLDIGDEPKAKWSLAVWQESVGSKPSQLEEEQVDQEIPNSAVDYYRNSSGNFRRRMTNDPWGA